MQFFLFFIIAAFLFITPSGADPFDQFIKEQTGSPYRNVKKEKRDKWKAHHKASWNKLISRLSDFPRKQQRQIIIGSMFAIDATTNKLMHKERNKYQVIDLYYLYNFSLGRHKYLLRLAKTIDASDISHHQQSLVNLYESYIHKKHPKPRHFISVMTHDNFRNQLKKLFKIRTNNYLTKTHNQKVKSLNNNAKQLIKDITLYGLNYTSQKRNIDAWAQSDEYKVVITCIPTNIQDTCEFAKQHDSLNSSRGPRPFSKTAHIYFFGSNIQISQIFRNSKKGLSSALKKQGKSLDSFAANFPKSVRKGICRLKSSFMIFAMSGIPHHVFLRSRDGHLLAYARIDNCKKTKT